MAELLLQDETYRIRGACFEVYDEKGCGFLENVYQECMEIELGMRAIHFTAQEKIRLTYKKRLLKSEYKPDLICFDQVIVELKAMSALVNEHRAQLHNYLKATGLRVGLLVNFGHHPGVEIERIVR